MTDTDPVSEGLGFIRKLGKAIDEGKGPAVAAALGLFDPETEQFANRVADVVVPHLKLTSNERIKLYGRLFGAGKGLSEMFIKRIPNEVVGAILEKSIDFGDFLYVHIVEKSVDRTALVEQQREKVLGAMEELTAEQRTEATEVLDDFYGKLSEALTWARENAGEKEPKIDRKKLRGDLGRLSKKLGELFAAAMDNLPEFADRGWRMWAEVTGNDPDEMMKTAEIETEARRLRRLRRELKPRRKAERRRDKEQAKLDEKRRKTK